MKWLIESGEATLAVVDAGGRRKALRVYQAAAGGVLHHSCRVPFLRVSGVGAVHAYEARVVCGEVVRADEANETNRGR